MIAEHNKRVTSTVKLTVRLNLRKLWMFSNTFLPQRKALTTEVKLSFITSISEAFFANSVPLLTKQKPTSAFMRAGASFVPSPIIAV